MSEIKENKMGTMPIGKLIFTMSIPMVASMLVQAFYNIIDSIFVAQFSDAALSAVTYAFPAQNLMIGLATGTGVGVNALLSRSLGEKNRERANRVAENGVFLYQDWETGAWASARPASTTSSVALGKYSSPAQ